MTTQKCAKGNLGKKPENKKKLKRAERNVKDCSRRKKGKTKGVLREKKKKGSQARADKNHAVGASVQKKKKRGEPNERWGKNPTQNLAKALGDFHKSNSRKGNAH